MQRRSASIFDILKGLAPESPVDSGSADGRRSLAFARQHPRWRRDLEGLLDSILVTAHELRRAQDRHGERVYLASVEERVLKALSKYLGYVGVSDLAARMKISRQAMHRLLTRFERDSLVELWPSPEGRRTLVALTSSGRSLIEDRDARRSAWLIDHFAHFDHRSIRNAAEAMDGIERALRRALADAD